MLEGISAISTVSSVSAGDLRRHIWLVHIGFGALAALTCLAAPLVGPTPISLRAVFDQSLPFAQNVDAQIFFIARLPRAIAGALVGASLATAGVVLQALLRNPLATPFTLGVSVRCSSLPSAYRWRSSARQRYPSPASRAQSVHWRSSTV